MDLQKEWKFIEKGNKDMRLIIFFVLSLTILFGCNSKNTSKKENEKKAIEKNKFLVDKRWVLKSYSFHKKQNDNYEKIYEEKLSTTEFVIQFNQNSSYLINNRIIGNWKDTKRRLELIQDNHPSKNFRVKDIPFVCEGVYIIDFGFRNRLRLIHHVLDKNKQTSSYFMYDFYQEVTDSIENIEIQL